MSDDLIAFLRARLDEDEQVARELKAAAYGIYPDGHGDAGLAFLRRFDEVRMLAEVEAKRQIVEEHSIVDPGEEWQHCRVCEDRFRHDAAHAPCATLRLLALPYADHPDCREEWRP